MKVVIAEGSAHKDLYKEKLKSLLKALEFAVKKFLIMTFQSHQDTMPLLSMAVTKNLDPPAIIG